MKYLLLLLTIKMKKEFEKIRKSKYFKYIVAFGIIKKVILLVMFLVPLLSFSQTYKDVMSISSVDMFKKVVIENGYEYDSTDNDWITYGYEIMRDSIEGNKSSKWTSYNTKNDNWSFRLSRTDALGSLAGVFLGVQSETDNSKNPYDLITDNIKEKCKYYKIQNYNGIDYVTYSCSESSYKGKIGFAISEGKGIIRHLIPE